MAMQEYYREDVRHLNKIPAAIYHQILYGEECFTPMHWHKDIEINLMLVGDAEFYVNGKLTKLQEGDFILINKDDLHTATAPRNIPVQDRYQELITMLWDYDWLNEYSDLKQELRFELPKDPQISREIRNLLISIALLNHNKEFAYEIDITSKILQIGSLLFKHCMVKDNMQYDRVHKKSVREMQEAITFIEENCTESITLDEVAEVSGLVPAYFSRRFREVTGVKYSEFLGQCRLKRSLAYLREEDMSITEVALESGFPNVKSYIEIFKRNYGTTPKQYQKMMGADLG